MKIKRITKLVLSSSLLLLSLAACSPENKDTTTPTSIPQTTTPAPSTSTPTSTTTSSTTADDIELVSKDINVTMASHFPLEVGNIEYKDKCYYNDSWFLENSHTVNKQLATASAMAAGASYSTLLDKTGTKIKEFLNEAGFKNIDQNKYYKDNITLDNSMGVIIGNKKLKDSSGAKSTLLAIMPRNAGYGNEWMGNFNLGTSGLHQGFKEARDEILRFMKKYISDNNITGKIKVWSSGYSRGAASVNLLGGFLATENSYFGDNITISPNDIFIYTIGAPAVTPSDVTKTHALNVSGPRGEGFFDTDVEAYTYAGTDAVINPTDDVYKGINNYIASGDYITKLPPKDWGFTRYGTTTTIDYGSEGMIDALSKISPSTANKFKDKNYVTKVSTKAVDFNSLKIIDKDTQLTPDEFIDSIVTKLVNISETRQGFAEKGYDTILGSATSVFGIDTETIITKFASKGIKDLAFAGVFSYLSHVEESLNLTDSEVLTKILVDIMKLLGKDIQDSSTYTDQQLLKDLLDLLINDYQKDNPSPRYEAIAKLIPSPYGNLYKDLLDYAKTKAMKPATVDDLVVLFSSYIHDNKAKKEVNDIVGKIADLIPNQYANIIFILATGKTYNVSDYPDEKTMKKTALFDAFDALILGKPESSGSTTPASTVRYNIYSAINAVLSFTGTTDSIRNLIMNGAKNGDTKIENTPVNISTLLNEILGIILPKNSEGKALTIKEAANKYLVNSLEILKTDKNSVYIENLKKDLDKVSRILISLTINPGSSYSFTNELDNAVTFIDMIKFLFPAHDHELYISAIKTMN